VTLNNGIKDAITEAQAILKQATYRTNKQIQIKPFITYLFS